MSSTPSTPRPFAQRDLAAALFVVIVWGLNFVAMKYALRYLTPFQLGAARYIFALLPLALLVRPPRMHWKWVAAFGLTQGVGQFGLLFVALSIGMTAGLASVLLQTHVFFTALLGVLLLGEGIGRPLRLGLVLAAGGLVCFAMNYVVAAGAGVTTVGGFVLTLLAALLWALSNIVTRKAQAASQDFSALAYVVWASLAPIGPFIVLSLLFDPAASRWAWTQAPLSVWLSAAYLGWVASVAGYGLWTLLLKRHPANRIAPFSLAVPVVGLSAGMLALGETVTAWQWAGITLVVLALMAVMLGGRIARLR